MFDISDYSKLRIAVKMFSFEEIIQNDIAVGSLDLKIKTTINTVSLSFISGEEFWYYYPYTMHFFR